MGVAERGGQQCRRKFYLPDGEVVGERVQDHCRHRPQRNRISDTRSRKENDQAEQR